jgi:hypothetical protein
VRLSALFFTLSIALSLPAVAQIVAAPPTSGGQSALITAPAGADYIYSLAQVQGYFGPCLQVKRASDGTKLNIGFVNGYCDFATAFAFGSATTLSLSEIYDQGGKGNDNPCTVGCPAVTAADAIRGLQGLIINSVGSNNDFPIPLTVTNNSQSVTVYSVAAPLNVGISALWQMTAIQNISTLLDQAGGPSDQIFQNNGVTIVGDITHVYSRTTEPEVTGLRLARLQ